MITQNTNPSLSAGIFGAILGLAASYYIIPTQHIYVSIELSKDAKNLNAYGVLPRQPLDAACHQAVTQFLAIGKTSPVAVHVPTRPAAPNASPTLNPLRPING